MKTVVPIFILLLLSCENNPPIKKTSPKKPPATKAVKVISEKEKKRKPLADNALSKALLEKGYKVARRTIAKYREQMNYPVARLRKEL